MQAVHLATAKGDVAGSPALLWSHDRHTPYVPSPLLYDDRIYFLKQLKGLLTCLDADDGAVLFTEQRLEGAPNVWASPVGAAGRVYVVGREGVTLVLRHGPTYEVLATNQLDDHFDASPAIVGGEILLRGRRFLYSLEAKIPVAPAGSAPEPAVAGR
jgi:outer membrane protein assembly factor BamB